MTKLSKRSPKVSKSTNKSDAFALRALAANAGSIKCLVLPDLTVALLLSFGVHAGKSSTIYRFLKAFR